MPIATNHLAELVESMLAGRRIDVVGFIDQLIDWAREGTRIRCTIVGEQALRFERDDEAEEIKVDASRAKLRMLCARLSVLCQPDSSVALAYEGVGEIPSACGAVAVAVQFKNTPDQQEFSLTLAGRG